MSKDTTQVNTPVNTYGSITVNRDSFLSIAKKLQKEIKKTNKETLDFKLSEIQEILSKSFGKRNWRELDELFNNTSEAHQNNVRTENNDDSLTVKAESIKKIDYLNCFLRSLQPTELVKILTFYCFDDLLGQRSKNLALIMSHIITQLKDEFFDLQEIDCMTDIYFLTEIYSDTINHKKETTITVTNKNEEENKYQVVLTNDIKVNIIKYFQSFPNYTQINETTNLSYTQNEIRFHQDHSNLIKENINLLVNINSNLVLYDNLWRYTRKELDDLASVEDWIFEFRDMFDKIRYYSSKTNWRYPIKNKEIFSYVELLIYYAKTVTEKEQKNTKLFISNLIDNIDTFKELIQDKKIQYRRSNI